MRTPLLLSLGLAAVLARPVQADVPPAGPPSPDRPALTLEQALALAAARSPTLVAARLELDAAGGAFDQAGARPNPELSLLVEDTRRATRRSRG